MKVLKDNRGTKIEVGSNVVFNATGKGLSFGSVVNISEKPTGGGYGYRTRTLVPTIEIRRVFPKPTVAEKDKIHKITATTKVFVLNEAPPLEIEGGLVDGTIELTNLVTLLSIAWDLDEVHMYLEEQFGREWRERFKKN